MHRPPKFPTAPVARREFRTAPAPIPKPKEFAIADIRPNIAERLFCALQWPIQSHSPDHSQKENRRNAGHRLFGSTRENCRPRSSAESHNRPFFEFRCGSNLGEETFEPLPKLNHLNGLLALRAIASMSFQALHIRRVQLAGEVVRATLSAAPGNNQPFGGIKVIADNGWFAARPSGTEDVYKIYAESFRSAVHLKQIQSDAQSAIARAFGG